MSDHLDSYALAGQWFAVDFDGSVWHLDLNPDDPDYPEDIRLGTFGQADRWVIANWPACDQPAGFADLADLESRWIDREQAGTDPRHEWEATYRHQQIGARA